MEPSGIVRVGGGKDILLDEGLGSFFKLAIGGVKVFPSFELGKGGGTAFLETGISVAVVDALIGMGLVARGIGGG